MRHFLTYWLPPLLWSAMILAASNDVLSSAHTGGMLEHFLAALGRSLAQPLLELVNIVLRKIGHVTAYGILGGLSFRAVRGTRSGWNSSWATTAVAIAVAIASIDEFRQSFIPSRTGTWHDVVLDGMAAVLVQMTIRAGQVLLFRPS